MKEKSIESSPDTFLILLLPLAFVIIFLFATWPLLLGILALSIGYNLWQRHKLQQWIEQVNPLFHQLIRANQGRITPLDLAMKANFPASSAKRYLDYKAEEFGAQRQIYEDLGTVYYFITSSTLGSLFDTSEPKSEEQQDEPRKDDGVKLGQELNASSEVIKPEAQTLPDSLIHSSSQASESLDREESQSHVTLFPPCLIQSELAKRLNVYSSTVYKRRDDPDFAEWSRSKDPEGIAWKYIAETKEFSPVVEMTSH